MPAWAQFRMDASRHVSRRAGQSAVAAAAYRAGQRLEDVRTGLVHDYTRRFGVVATGLCWPLEAEALDWDRNQLWNEAEAAERRADARVARKLELALPEAMDDAQRQALVEIWAAELSTRYGVAVDWAIHRPDREGDQRNHHAHLLLSTRRLGRDGFGAKAALELSSAEQRRRGLPVGAAGLLELRQVLAEQLNRVAAAQGLALRADPRSYADRGIALIPTRHVGVHATALHRQGQASERADAQAAIRAENAAAILARPERILELLTEREAVFTRQDMARVLHRYLDDPEQFRDTLARLEASPELVSLAPAAGRRPARFSTWTMVALEAQMMTDAAALAARQRKPKLAQSQWTRLQARQAELSAEQRAAVAHVVAPAQLAVVAGIAGGGKSAALGAAREVWQAAGYRVRGAALAGKAADALQHASGIESRTLHALEYGWRRGRDRLAAGDVLVIDEAGMVGSRQMARVLAAAAAAGAKVVLVGDARQLQPIEAGAAFRAIAEQVGVAEIETVRRQDQAWAREASQALARGDVATGLAAYAARGHVHLEADRAAAKAALVREYLAGEGGGGDRLIVAHSQADVLDLNARVRAARQERGELGDEQAFGSERGERRFASGDRVVFLRNERALGVKNGTLGTVQRAATGSLRVQLDDGAAVVVDQAVYAAIEHGYAVTLHKAQGATVAQAFVLATAGMDRHLAYVGLTRHRQRAELYGGRDEFADGAALAERLGRARPKRSTLDYAERRGVETERSWLEETLGWLERGRDRLTAVWDRAQRARYVVLQREQKRAEAAQADAVRRAAAMEQARAEAAARAEQESIILAQIEAEKAATLAEEQAVWRAEESAYAEAAQRTEMEAGKARARERFELRRRDEALAARREAEARSLVREWNRAEQDYTSWMADPRPDGQYGAVLRDRFASCGSALGARPDLVALLRTSGAALGVGAGSRLQRVVQAAEPRQALLNELAREDDARSARLVQLQRAREQEAARVQQKPVPRSQSGPSMGW